MVKVDMLPAFSSKEGSGWQRLPQGCPSSRTEKKAIKTISKNPDRKNNHLRRFPKIQIERNQLNTFYNILIEKKPIQLVGKASLEV